MVRHLHAGGAAIYRRHASFSTQVLVLLNRYTYIHFSFAICAVHAKAGWFRDRTPYRSTLFHVIVCSQETQDNRDGCVERQDDWDAFGNVPLR